MRAYQAAPLVEGEALELDTFASHHIANVMRAGVGGSLSIFNDHGNEHHATIIKISKKSVFVQIGAPIVRNVEPPVDIVLAQCISRGEKMDFTIQKAIELGVKKIVPLFSERSTVKLDEKRGAQRLLHWQRIAIGACEQCGRNRLPAIVAPQPFKQGLPLLQADWRLILCPQAMMTVRQFTTNWRPAQSIILLVGPEGGLSDKEIQFAKTHDFHPLALGPRILRTETAALAALAILQSHVGDM